MNRKSVLYWSATVPFVAMFTMSAVSGLAGGGAVQEGIARLGYPAYFVVLLSLWKLAGVLALVAPGLPRLKEWAYAGFFFTLTGASVSHAAAGDPTSSVVTPIVLVAVGLASYLLRPAGRTLPE